MTYYADLLLAHISGWIVCGVVQLWLWHGLMNRRTDRMTDADLREKAEAATPERLEALAVTLEVCPIEWVDHMPVGYGAPLNPDGPAAAAVIRAVAAELTALRAKVKAQGEAIESAEAIFTNCTVSANVCCCGSEEANHDAYTGHGFVDMGEHAASEWLKSRRAAQEANNDQ